MFGGLGNMNSGQMKALMKQMGIKQEDIIANKVIIEQEDKRVIIESATVTKITMQGQESWQVTGEAREETKEAEISAEDVQMVAEKTGKSMIEARKVLEETNGNLAEAIVKLSK